MNSYLLKKYAGTRSPFELSIIAIEKKLLSQLKRSTSFNDNVIKSFKKKKRRFDLEYK